MDSLNIICIIGTFALVAVAALIVVAPGFILGGVLVKGMLSSAGEKQKVIDAERAEQAKYEKSIFDSGGVWAPGVIISARVVRWWGKGRTRVRVLDCEVDVTPEQGAPFRTKVRFEHSGGNIVVVIKGEMTSLHGQKVWIVFDPNDTNRAYFHHYEDEHEEALAVKAWTLRRNEFVDAEAEAMRVREIGEEALATILDVEDLNVATRDEQKTGKTLRLKFRVTPKGGFPFESQTTGMISIQSLPKLVVGNQVYVKFDPQKQESSALIRAADS